MAEGRVERSDRSRRFTGPTWSTPTSTTQDNGVENSGISEYQGEKDAPVKRRQGISTKYVAANVSLEQIWGPGAPKCSCTKCYMFLVCIWISTRWFKDEKMEETMEGCKAISPFGG